MRVEHYDVLKGHDEPQDEVPTKRVRFWLNDNTFIVVSPHPHHANELSVYLAGTGRFGQLAIAPECANMFRVGAIDSLNDLNGGEFPAGRTTTKNRSRKRKQAKPA